ncbi:hypothetical protein EVAR_91539_1 [Eumeta japonica]|uniref:Uncharacterized protein n=1 Tax=Eumeta variegata TaxID=151549 RepID=A0A4C1VCJ3_EUMVA|nr:hypothetical protein EVAR_91539_1 [Eumeta japonica]
MYVPTARTRVPPSRSINISELPRVICVMNEGNLTPIRGDTDKRYNLLMTARRTPRTTHARVCDHPTLVKSTSFETKATGFNSDRERCDLQVFNLSKTRSVSRIQFPLRKSSKSVRRLDEPIRSRPRDHASYVSALSEFPFDMGKLGLFPTRSVATTTDTPARSSNVRSGGFGEEKRNILHSDRDPDFDPDPALDSHAGTACYSDFGHDVDFNLRTAVDFDLDFFLDFEPGSVSVLDSAPRCIYNSDSLTDVHFQFGKY